MKKYNRMFAVSIGLYLMLALAAGILIKTSEEKQGKYHKIEINRIYNSLSEENSFDELDLRSYETIKQVEYLPLSESEEETVTGFYQGSNTLQKEIRPWYYEGKLQGYLRFDYLENSVGIESVLLIMEAALFVMAVLMMGILLYLKYRLIQPFINMSGMPEQLAKGRLKADLKEEKNKYFGKFMWGIGQLKDNLDATKKRTLELEKEKKEMLLSLSHDIKTPLNTIRLYGKALKEEVYVKEAEKKHAAHQIGVKTGEIERYVDEIIKNAREDILDIQIENQDFYLADMMKNVLDVYREKCETRMIFLEVQAYENCLLKGDINRAQEVLENIFENAFKYGDGRKIEITFYEEDYCRLVRIFNTGIPVTDNEFNHIFESFFRGGNSEGKPGSGLGLYICREIMRKMGGEIFAQKEKDGMGFVVVFR